MTCRTLNNGRPFDGTPDDPEVSYPAIYDIPNNSTHPPHYRHNDMVYVNYLYPTTLRPAYDATIASFCINNDSYTTAPPGHFIFGPHGLRPTGSYDDHGHFRPISPSRFDGYFGDDRVYHSGDPPAPGPYYGPGPVAACLCENNIKN